MENRYNDEAIVCNGDNSLQYTLSTPADLGNGNTDSAILVVTHSNGKTTNFFKSVLNVCIVDAQDCDQVISGRGENLPITGVRLSGMIASCESTVPQYETLLLVSTTVGQTLADFQKEILQLCGRM